MPHRCALGCKNTDVIMHVFPNPVKFPERFKAWVDLVGEKPEIPLDVEYFKKKRICDIHFIPEHRNRNKRLNALAIPLLNLPGLPKSQESENSADNQPGTSFAAAVITSGVPRESENSLVVTQSTTFSLTSSSIIQESEIRREPHTGSSTVPSGSSIIQESEIRREPHPGSSTVPSGLRHHGVLTATVIKEHNYSVLSRPRQTPFVKGGPTTTAAYKRVEMKPLQTKIKYLRTELCRLRKKGQSFTERLANACMYVVG